MSSKVPYGLTPSRTKTTATSHRSRRGLSAGPETAGITDEQLDEVNQAFELFDTDKDGLIDYHEFKVAMRALGFILPRTEVTKLLKENDNGEGLMKRETFERISE
jgi:centrin-3